jgi:CTP synthase
MAKTPRKTAQKKSARSKKCNYIFVVGGVMSGVGKGITTASIGTVLQSKGFSVSLMKADPYLNVDAGTMNPTEHGEVFVLESGLETDQDMGNYERFLNQNLPKDNYMTNGMVFKYVIDKERALGYNGKCVEPTFHIIEEILRRIESARKKNQSRLYDY